MPGKDHVKDDSSSDGINTGLLILRIFGGLSLFLKHGLDRFTGYSAVMQYLPDPFRMGTHASVTYALISDGICSVFVILGFATRPAVVLILINLCIAFFLENPAAFFTVPRVEIIWLYIAISLTLLCTGPGSIILDARLRRPKLGIRI
jgi:putative oxidoreductase